MTRAIVGLVLLVWMAAPAGAQMPDAGQMAGVPLPAGDLPDGTLTVRVVRQELGNNLPNQTVTLKGGGPVRSATTDAEGRARFDGLPAGVTFTAEAVVDGETLASRPFEIAARGGVRVVLVAGLSAAGAQAAGAPPAPPRPGTVEFAGDTRFIFEYQDDRLQVFYLLEIVNAAAAPVDVGGPLQLDLPPGAVGATVLEGSSAQASVQGERVTIAGPFQTGKTVVQIGFTMPERETLSVRQRLPAALTQTFVAAEQVGALRLFSPQLTDTREVTAEGQRFVLGTGGRLDAGDTLAIDLTGLPAHSATARYAALGLATAVLAAGFWLAFAPRDRRAASLATLTAQRDRLMSEVVGLERKRRQHPLTAGEEARRQHLVRELEKVLAQLDDAPAGSEGLAA
jgi:hypothetical protein